MMPDIGADGALGRSAVGFGDAIAICFRKYAMFRGRARRPEYWWWFLFQVLVSIVASILDRALFTTGVFSVFSALTTLILLLPTVAVTVRRLHDIDRPGWWLLILVIPIGGMVVLVIMTCMRGADGSNRFGPEFAGSSQAAATA
jgi:uncharacterized membrane protein YhaH (DUF805 family)